MIAWLIVAVLVSAHPSYSSNCPLPNGTGEKLFFQTCSSKDNTQLLVKNITITDQYGRMNYPVDLNQPLRLSILVENRGDTIASLLSDVDLQIYQRLLWGTCNWYSLPSFGLLKNIDECIGCPLPPGFSKVVMRINPTRFVPLVALMSKGVAYAVQTVARDGQHPKKTLSCFRVEGVIWK